MNKKVFSTSNLFLATTLSLFHPIESINYTAPQRAEFVFVSGQHLDNLINNYWRGDLKVEPKAIFSQLKIVKSRLYEGGNDK